jgi:hypothetical protein
MRRAWLVALVLGGSALADPRPMSTGSSPAPVTSEQVALVSERLSIDVTRKDAAVDAQLHLKNGGAATTLQVGFPCVKDLSDEIAGLGCATKIEVSIGGKRVAAKQKNAHWIWSMHFEAGQEVDLRVTYRSPLVNDRYETPFLGMGALHYQLTTGAAWAGKIDSLHMEVRLPTDAIIGVSPAGAARAHGMLTWDLKDVEPDRDLVVLVHPIFLGRYAGVLKAETREELVKKLESGDYAKDKLAAVAAEWQKQMPEILRYAHWFVHVTGGWLPDFTDDEIRATTEESLRLMR